MNQIPNSIKRVYLMAICGTGMGSLAGLLKSRGFDVAGSDANVYPPMSHELEKQDIPIFTPYAADNLSRFKPDLVIVGNAISQSNVEAQYMLDNNLAYVSMPQALKRFFLADKDVIVVSGTHGKTTTTTLMAFLLDRLGLNPSYLIGGVSLNFASSFHIGAGKHFVIEGDEYDTAFFDKGPKFLHYNPKHVIMTSLEFDHADIYRDLDHLTESFKNLAKLIPADGSLHYCPEGYPRLEDAVALAPCEKRAYGFKTPSWLIRDFTESQAGSRFTLCQDGRDIVTIASPMPGRHNALNAAACFSVLHALGADLEKAAAAFASFAGVKRRQELLLDDATLAVIDDFAHHPTAVAETIAAVRGKFPGRKLVAIFEPRSNSSMRDVFQKGYNDCFMAADETLLAPVFNPKKITDGKILDVPLIVDNLKRRGKTARLCPTTGEIIRHVVAETKLPTVALVMSNGGFEDLPRRLVAAWKESKSPSGTEPTRL